MIFRGNSITQVLVIQSGELLLGPLFLVQTIPVACSHPVPMKAAGVLERSLHPGIQSSNISDSNTYLITLSATRVFWCQLSGPTLPSRFFKLDTKRQRWAKPRRIASSLSISPTAINCFLTDASTKRGRSDLYFKSAAAASPQAGEEESSFLSCLRAVLCQAQWLRPEAGWGGFSLL